MIKKQNNIFFLYRRNITIQLTNYRNHVIKLEIHSEAFVPPNPKEFVIAIRFDLDQT